MRHQSEGTEKVTQKEFLKKNRMSIIRGFGTKQERFANNIGTWLVVK
jgi:hypothetical protein